MLGVNFIPLLSRNKTNTRLPKRMNLMYLKFLVLKKDQYFYICGPKSFEFETRNHLLQIGIVENQIQTGYQFKETQLTHSNLQ